MSQFPEDKIITISVTLLTRYRSIPKVINLYDKEASKDLDVMIDLLIRLRKSEFYEESGTWKG